MTDYNSNSLDQYQIDAISTAGTLGTDTVSLATLGLGIAGEAGEVADHLKKIIGHGHPLDDAALAKLQLEIGDVLWYVATLGHVLGFTLSEIATANRVKLMARYPDGFESERSLNREDNPLRLDNLDGTTQVTVTDLAAPLGAWDRARAKAHVPVDVTPTTPAGFSRAMLGYALRADLGAPGFDAARTFAIHNLAEGRQPIHTDCRICDAMRDIMTEIETSKEVWSRGDE